MTRRSLTLSGNVPQWLYELLPALYAAGGVLTLFYTPHWIGTGSGALLLVTSAHVLWLRKRMRGLPHATRPDGEAALLGMAWLRAFEIDHPAIDAEHRELFAESHLLLEAILSGSQRQVREQIGVLTQAIRTHFRNEDEILAQDESARSRSHRRAHRRIEEQLEKILRRFEKGKVSRGALVHFLLYDVVRMHMLVEDSEIPTIRIRRIHALAH